MLCDKYLNYFHHVIGILLFETSFKVIILGFTILQGVELSIFLLIFEWAIQQCSATALPVMNHNACMVLIGLEHFNLSVTQCL